MPTKRTRIIHTDKAPKAIGPYSQAVQTDTLVMTAGQIGLDPSTGNLVEGGVEAQTRQVLTNLKNVLEAADSGLDLVLKTSVYLKEMKDFAQMNAIYAGYFPADPPARSTVAAAELPKGALVEIDVIALRKSARKGAGAH